MQVHNRYIQLGGEDTVVSSERLMLENEGHEVSLFEISNDVLISFLSKVKTALAANYSKNSRNLLAKQLDKVQPDIVHVHNFFPLLTSSIYDACLSASIPVVQTLHNYRPICPGGLLLRDGRICEKCIAHTPYSAVLHGCYRGSRLESFVVARMVDYNHKKKTWYEKVDGFIALTDFAKYKFVEGGFPKEKIYVKPNFTKGTFDGTKKSIKNDLYALYVGRLSQEKGLDVLLRAWKEISLPIHIVGDGPMLSLVRNSVINSLVVFGRLPSERVSMKMSEANFLVLPSKWYEGFPMVLVEAFAHGLPVIASKLGGMAEIIDDGVTGLLFEPGNSRDLAEKVLWMQYHPDKCKEMSENARRVYLEKYTSKKNYKMLMQIYKKIINEYK